MLWDPGTRCYLDWRVLMWRDGGRACFDSVGRDGGPCLAEGHAQMMELRPDEAWGQARQAASIACGYSHGVQERTERSRAGQGGQGKADGFAMRWC